MRKMNKLKIIANYLPQYHQIPENDKWWGEGYTDWTAVKASKPQFKGHLQPRVPINKAYYSLDDVNVIKKQAELALKYGISGWGIYHYWFNSNQHLLHKPAEIILSCEDISIPFFFIWDNSTWKRTWSNVKSGNEWAPLYEGTSESDNNGILALLDYGSEKDWKIHFDYLVQFFKDARYIKVGNKPVFSVFNGNNDYETILKMCSKWNEWAKDRGFDGMYFISGRNNGKHELEYNFMYTPFGNGSLTNAQQFFLRVYRKICTKTNRPQKFNYDKVWRRILNNVKECNDKNVLYGGFVGYDDTPRRGVKARIVIGQTPEKFEKYIKDLILISKKRNKEFLFITAWNEWGEGAYLEPDEENGYAYLEALKRAIDSVNE